jgi:hypothetical protein
MNRAEGINFKEKADYIEVGIKKRQFIEYLEKQPEDANGWLNFRIKKRSAPTVIPEHNKYSHVMISCGDKWESVKKENEC